MYETEMLGSHNELLCDTGCGICAKKYIKTEKIHKITKKITKYSKKNKIMEN